MGSEIAIIIDYPPVQAELPGTGILRHDGQFIPATLAELAAIIYRESMQQ